MPTATVLGATGLTGSQILTHLLSSPAWSSVTTISRRQPSVPTPPPSKLTTTLSPDLKAYPTLLPSPPPDVVFSALGTTRAAVGGIQNQWPIDHDANVDFARASKAAGVKTFVFISAGGTRGMLSKMAPYSKMKIGVEEAIREAGFDNAVILRPGLIIGQREQNRIGEVVAEAVVNAIGKVSKAGKDMFGQEASVIGRAAVRAAELAAEGKAPEKFWVLEAADIVKYGSPEGGAAAPGSAPATTAAPGGEGKVESK